MSLLSLLPLISSNRSPLEGWTMSGEDDVGRGYDGGSLKHRISIESLTERLGGQDPEEEGNVMLESNMKREFGAKGGKR